MKTKLSAPTKIQFIQLFIVVHVFFTFNKISATVINVPADMGIIQEAIDIAISGDTVLVSQGTYYENIDFMGKSITVSSNYIFSGNLDDIYNTVIDGSQCENTDTCSVVTFASGETANAVIQGFTITGGKGTIYIYPNGKFREGGGIYIDEAAPTIKNNLIIENKVINPAYVISNGGGGLRCNMGNPTIVNNTFMLNEAFFGSAIVLDYSSATIRNNIVYCNSRANVYTGGSFWISTYGTNAINVVIENNTIVGNFSSFDCSGGIYVGPVKIKIKNNILWNNTNSEIAATNISDASNFKAEYNNIEGGFAGKGNINEQPLLLSESFLLNENSPCFDKGDSTSAYFDKEDPMHADTAAFPSLGTIRNDMGAFGGPGASPLPLVQNISAGVSGITNYKKIPVDKDTTLSFLFINNSTDSVELTSVDFNTSVLGNFHCLNTFPVKVSPINSYKISFLWNTSEVVQVSDTLIFNYSLSDSLNYTSTIIYLKSFRKISGLEEINNSKLSFTIYPNPASSECYINYNINEGTARLAITDLAGREIVSYSGLSSFGTISPDMNFFNPGLYICKLFTSDSQKILKMIIK